MVPKMTSSTTGSSTMIATPGSRESSLTCIPISALNPRAVIRRRGRTRRSAGRGETVAADMSVLLRLVGEADEGVVQAGLLDPQPVGDDLTAGQQRGDRL